MDNPNKIKLNEILGHLGENVNTEGIVKNTDELKFRLSVGTYECQRCGSIIKIKQTGIKQMLPSICETCEKKGPFELITDKSEFKDCQEIIITDRDKDNEVKIFLETDEWQDLEVGEHIEVEGIVHGILKRGTRILNKAYIDAQSLNRVG